MQALLSLLVFLLQPGGGNAPAVAEAALPTAPSKVVDGAAAPSAEVPDSQFGLATPVRGEAELIGLWQLRKKAVADGDEARADDLQRQVLVQRRELGIERLDAFALDLLDEAGRASTERADSARSAALVGQARTLSLPVCRRSKLRRRPGRSSGSPGRCNRWLVHTGKGMSLRLADFQRRTLLASDFVWTAFILAGVLTGLFLLSQLLRHGLAIYHGLGHTFPGVLRIVLLAAAALIGAVPLYFGFGPVLLVFPLLILIWPLQRAGERAISVSCVLVLGATPWVLRAVDRLSEAGTGATQALYELGGNPHHPRAAETVAAALARRPTDWQAAFVQGVSQKRQGRLDEAIESLTRAAAHVQAGEPEAARIQNDLGNALFASGRPMAAEKAYLEAIRLDGQRPEPHFNLSRLYTRTVRLDKARERFGQASALDPDRVAQWNEDLDPNLNRFCGGHGVDRRCTHAARGRCAAFPESACHAGMVAHRRPSSGGGRADGRSGCDDPFRSPCRRAASQRRRRALQPVCDVRRGSSRCSGVRTAL
jgi:tetratricopeptide (TPR) repeat protein